LKVLCRQTGSSLGWQPLFETERVAWHHQAWRVALDRGDSFAASYHLGLLDELKIDGSGAALVDRARTRAARGEWKNSLKDFERVHKDTGNPLFAERALLRLLNRDDNGYQALCREMLQNA